MSSRENPYQAPRAALEAGPASPSSRSAARVFVAWLVGASLVRGAALALQTGHALAAFGAEGHLAGLLAVSALRTGATQVAASACSVAIAWATHRRLGAQRPLWQTCALVPLAAPVAASVMIVVGVGVTAFGYGAPPRTSWQSIRTVVTPGDALFGLALAGVVAIVLGALAVLLEPRLSAVRAGLLARTVVALLATGLITGAVQGALGALLSADDDVGAPLRESPIGDLLPGASLIVRAIVVDNNTSVKASAMQTEVSPDQGWAAALIRPTRVLKGSQPGDLILVNNMAVRDKMSWRRPVEATNGQERIFYLKKDETLSRWCRMNVYREILE